MTIPNDHAVSTTDLEKRIRKFAKDVRELLLRHPETAELATKLEARLIPVLNAQMSDEPIVGVILGQQDTGKSTLLNKIVGKENCAPIGYNETTENISRFQFGRGKQCNQFRVYWYDREPENLPRYNVKDWIEGGKNTPDTVLLDFFVESEFLKTNNIVLIDTHGTGSTKTNHDEEIRQFLQGEHEATTQHGVIPHILIYAVFDARPETVSKLDEYAQALGILPECSIVVVQSPDKNAKEMCELLRENLKNKVSIVLLTDEIETLKKKLSDIPDPHLIKVLTVYRIVSNVHEKAVVLLEDIVREEEEHKQRGEKLRDSLKVAAGRATPGISSIESREVLQTAVSHLGRFEDLRESLGEDLRSREKLIEDCGKILEEARGGIASFPQAAAAFSKAQEKLDESWNQEKQRIEDSGKVWKEALSATPQVIGHLEAAETYLTEAKYPPTVHDVYETAQNYLDDLIPGIEKRIIYVNQLLKDLREIKDGIQQKVDLFEKDIRYLVLLKASASGLREGDRKELLCLFGRDGTNRSSRLKFKPDDQDTYISGRISYWTSNFQNALDRDHEAIFDHAIARLEDMFAE